MGRQPFGVRDTFVVEDVEITDPDPGGRQASQIIIGARVRRTPARRIPADGGPDTPSTPTDSTPVST